MLSKARIFEKSFSSLWNKTALFPSRQNWNELVIIPSCTFTRQIKKPKNQTKNDKGDTLIREQSISSSSSISPTKIKSKYNLNQSSKNSSVEDPNSPNAIPFDQFTRELVEKSKEKSKELDDDTVEEIFRIKSEIPWDFDGIIKTQPEKNLKCPVSLTRLINFNTVNSLFKRYLTAIEEKDLDELQDILEHTFYRKFCKLFEKLDQKGLKFTAQHIEKENNIDLFNITNYFTVGVESNRKKNSGESSYFIHDGYIQDIPTKHIITRRLQGDELATIKVNVDITIETSATLKLVDKDGTTLAENTGEKSYHHLKLENDILHVAYKNLKYAVNFDQKLNDQALSTFKFALKQDNWRIIDVDNFMDGNSLIPKKVIIF